ncbi:MAG: metallophosphoesterase [Elusimicrobia bacterium]|nr:metallophosphoesterase [Elusimicrobiota bacterium]
MKASLRFAVLTDIHLTDSAEFNRERLALDSVRLFEEARADAEGRGPDFLFYTGDLFEARHWGLPHLALARRILEKTRPPWFVLMGNHDARYKTTRDAYDGADFVRAFAGHGPTDSRPYWSHEVPESPFVFLGLHTARNFTSGGGVDREQLAWLQAELKRFADRYVVVMMHHPAVVFDPVLESVPELSIYYLENHAEVRELLVGHRCVKLALSGHNHTRRHAEIAGLHFVGCPSINSWPNMYAAFQISAKKISFDFHQIRDQAKVREAYAGVVHPESTWLKGFKDGAAVAAYFSAGPAIRELAPRR